MPDIKFIVIASIVVIVLFVIIAFAAWKMAISYHIKVSEAKIGSAEDRAREIIDDALKTAETKKREAMLEAKEEALKKKNELERETKEQNFRSMKKEFYQKKSQLIKRWRLLKREKLKLYQKKQS